MKRHSIDPLSFVLGVFFLVTGLVFAFGGDASKLHIAWFWPVVLGVTGLGLMLLTLRAVRPERQTVPAAEGPTTAETTPVEPILFAGDQDAPGQFDVDADTPAAAEPGADDLDR